MTTRAASMRVLAGAACALLSGVGVARAENDPLRTTTRPIIASATALGPHTLQACFDKPILTTANVTDANFFLQGYTESRKTGVGGGVPGLTGAPTPDPSDAKCMVLGFTGQADIRTYSRAVGLNGAVTGSNGRLSISGAVALTGSIITSPSGLILRPQLASTAVTPGTGSTPTSATFTFTTNLSQTVNASRLGFYTNVPGDTAFHAGTSGTVLGKTVVVGFAPADQALLTSSTSPPSRWAAQAGAVSDPSLVPNPVGVVGGSTQRPDLAPSGGRLSTTTYAFDFSVPVNVVNPAGLHVYDAGGIRWDAVPGSLAMSSDNRRATVTVTPVNGDPSAEPAEITLQTVDAGAVVAVSNGVPGSDGAQPIIELADHPFLTTGPDPLAYSIDKPSGVVAVIFDEPINCPNPQPCLQVNPNLVQVVDAQGNVSGPPGTPGSPGLLGIGATPPGPPTFLVNNNVLRVFFGTSSSGFLGIGASTNTALTDNAVGVIINEGAVRDFAGVLNPLASYGPPGPAPPSSPTPPPSTPPAPSGTTAPPGTTTTEPTTSPPSKRARRTRRRKRRKVRCRAGQHHAGGRRTGRCVANRRR